LANRRWIVGILTVLIVLAISSVGLFLFARDSDPAREIHQLVDESYNRQRPGSGRLSGATYSRIGGAGPVISKLGRAQMLLLRGADSEAHQRLQGLVYLAAGEWQRFVDIANKLSVQTSRDAPFLNNLGASYLALAENDPALILNAVEEFERASKLDPKAPEPLFNLVIAYRQLHFPKIAAEYFAKYTAVDASSAWQHELAIADKEDEASIVAELEESISTNVEKAERLFKSNPELCRRLAMQYAFSNEQESPDLIAFIASQMERRYGDSTISGMLAPLLTDQRETTIRLRKLVNRGARLYTDGNFAESLAAYTEASKLAGGPDSFDSLWIDLNRVDTEIRLGKFDEARKRMARIIPTARDHGFLWLYAKALSIYGSTLRLTSSYTEMLDLLSSADQGFVRIDAPHDRIRVLYSLAYYHSAAGDQNEALKVALECLRLVNEGDTVRTSTLDWLIGSILYRLGMAEKALLFARESVEQNNAGYANGIGVVAPITLGQLYQSTSQYKLADKYFKIAEGAFDDVPQGFDKIRLELILGVAKAKAKMSAQKYDDAQSLLERNLKLYSQQPFSATPLLSQSLMLLGQVYSETGRIEEAARKFTEAIEVVEKDDEYLKSEGLRVKFDDERRDLYDSAIDFEFRNGSVDAAWTYLQKYRAKLFLEFLAAFNPKIAPGRSRPDRAEIQQRIPKDTQIVEYALLKDRLLIWVVTDKVFTVRSVSATRADVEAKVETVLEKLRTGEDADPLLTELGQSLIEPIRDLLDPERTMTIIPDRALHGLPFGALKEPGKSRYIIQDFAVVISPSLTHFLTSSGDQPSREAVVGFGSQNGGSSEFRELAALADIYPKTMTFTRDDVDKRSFLDGLRTAAVFHYAGHSATDAIDPLRSSILLDGNRSGPNSVTAVDISQTRLRSNAVVILSSCDSSVGNSRDGIGVRGLTSAFLIGGAGSVVGSLWPVEASSTADLMIRFHRAFANSRMPVAKALREAQLTFLKAFPERSHPYYWSGFVVTGDATALR